MLTKTQRERAIKEISSAFGFQPSSETVEHVLETIQSNKATLRKNDRSRIKTWELELFPGVWAHVEYNNETHLITAVHRLPGDAPQVTEEPAKKQRHHR